MSTERTGYTQTLTVKLYSLGPNADLTNMRAELEQFLDGAIQYTHQVAAVVTGDDPRPSWHTVVDTGEGIIIATQGISDLIRVTGEVNVIRNEEV